jgi:hypothetical protein
MGAVVVVVGGVDVVVVVVEVGTVADVQGRLGDDVATA